MEKIHMAQIAKTLVLFIFLVMIPFISSSMRTSYLYFILNLLILILAIESGFFNSDSNHEKKQVAAHSHLSSLLPNNPNINIATTNSSTKNSNTVTNSSTLDRNNNDNNKYNNMSVRLSVINEKRSQNAATKVFKTQPAQKKMKKSTSRPSIFFIGGFADEENVMKEAGNRVKQIKKEKKIEEEFFEDDLFARAETFIGNFYQQLKIQREESWKKIHGLYCKPF